ncbi:prepilin-type N-terminal cleavage/methylation domain-containing protein [Jatrophihabitans sp.]|uniref:prepilin-type N-terminal cleavage/methylation domain-containing protein n=1 Tax=Jatrophihabitans sp. TaxID=1932789 RepID=UPI0030C6A3CD|nr:hypothetical protein [Jatrophihabitans sp.]
MLSDRFIDDDRGTTLIELMVGMLICAILGSLALSWFLNSDTVNQATTSSNSSTASARYVLQQWAKMVQLAGTGNGTTSTTNGITAISPTSITFNAYLNNPTVCPTGTSCSALATSTVTLALTSNQLTESIGGHSPSVDFSSQTGTVTPVTTGGCVFTPYANSTPLGCSNLTTTQLAQITSLSIAFTATTSTKHKATYQTSAALVPARTSVSS